MLLLPRTIKILISNWSRTRKFSQLFKNTGGEDLFLPWSRVGHPLRSIFMLWLVKIWQVSSCGKLIQPLETCLLWQLKLTEFCVNLWCFISWCLFPLDVQNEIYSWSRVFCYSWLVCLLGFWLRNVSLLQVGDPISDGIVFVFHLSWCVRGFLKSLKRFWPYLIASRSCISNGKPE